MKYYKTITLKDGRACILRNGTEQDGQAMLNIYIRTHAQTDYLLSYPESNEIELLAELEGSVVASAGIACVGPKEKTRHRAEFGISVDKDFWGLGIGRALTEACIECARAAGYLQMELEVVAENEKALSLYRSLGFVEYGRNPRGFRSRLTGWQELLLMRLELEQ